MAALPYVVMVVMVQVGGQLADLIRKRDLLSTTNTRRFFTAGGNQLFGINLMCCSNNVANYILETKMKEQRMMALCTTVAEKGSCRGCNNTYSLLCCYQVIRIKLR